MTEQGNDLVKLLAECPVPVSVIHRELEAMDAGISHSTVQSWSTGRTFPTDENREKLAEALERLGGRTAGVAERVRSVQRPATLSAGKRGKGKRGRPPLKDKAKPAAADAKGRHSYRNGIMSEGKRKYHRSPAGWTPVRDNDDEHEGNVRAEGWRRSDGYAIERDGVGGYVVYHTLNGGRGMGDVSRISYPTPQAAADALDDWLRRESGGTEK